jgi:hypothetical protein
MDDRSSPDVASFVIRFVRDQQSKADAPAYRGIVRHVQTDEEINFTCWEEVEVFIQRVIPLETESRDTKGVSDEIEG